MKKILIMGKSGSGKTSMRSVVFADYSPQDTQRLGATFEVECSHVRFRGELLCLNIWDCGGQDHFMEEYFNSKKYVVFRQVDILVYVFDVTSSTFAQDVGYLLSALQSIREHSKQAKVFCFIHKIDLVPPSKRCVTFENMKRDLQYNLESEQCIYFATSILDESLYRPWSTIVNSLVRDMETVTNQLSWFRNIMEADEVFLIDKMTFLLVSHEQSESCLNPNSDRYEKIIKVLNNFKKKCAKLSIKFEEMEIKNSTFFAVIEKLTKNLFIMVVMYDCFVTTQGIRLNIKNAREHFENVEKHQRDVSFSESLKEP